MKTVEFSIDKVKYKIDCPEEEEQKILTLSKIIDKKAQKLRSHLKGIDDKALLAILCLTIQDEASNENKRPNKKTPSQEDQDLSEMITKETIQNLNQVTKKIETLAKKIENY